MKKSPIYGLLCLILILTSCGKENPVEPSKTVLTDNPKITDLDKLVDNTFKAYAAKSSTAGFSIALINGTQVSQYNYGETKLGNKTLPNNQTLYEIGSITKVFTAIATHYWVTSVKGMFISTPIEGFLPSNLATKLSLNDTKVSFKQLLNHTSGFPRIPNNLPNNADPYNGYDSTKIYNYILNNNLLRTPGTTPNSEQEAFNFYSNFAYGVAGTILERNHNQSLNTIFQNYIFNDLNMSNTTLNNIESISNRAFPHNISNNASYWHFSGMAGAGGLKSCLSDMVKFAQKQLSTAVGNSYQICQQPTVQINGKDYFGLGWEYFYTSTRKRITVKDGGTGGFTAFIAFEKTSQKAIVALFNNGIDNNPGESFVNLLEEFFK
ncbi:MAG: serine hydrolase domain-containing protein [Chloroherpetonaceae bacterium]